MFKLFAEIGTRWGGMCEGDKIMGIFQDGAMFLYLDGNGTMNGRVMDKDRGERWISRLKIEKVIRLEGEKLYVCLKVNEVAERSKGGSE